MALKNYAPSFKVSGKLCRILTSEKNLCALTRIESLSHLVSWSNQVIHVKGNPLPAKIPFSPLLIVSLHLKGTEYSKDET